MNVLLIGGANDLTNRLIAIFNKEGHRVSLLTGSYHGKKKYERVFEQYNFLYTSNVLAEIFESVSPDLTVFTGIHDSYFKWKDTRADSVAFVSAVLNILNAYSLIGKGRLLFLSSDAVFQPSHSAFLSEKDEPNAADLRGMALIEAENLCEKYRAAFQADIITVRLSGFYHIPEKPEDVDDPVSEMCLQALIAGPLYTASQRSMMLLYSADAAFFLSRLALAEHHEHAVYHLSSGVVITEQELAAKVNRALLEQRDNGKQTPDPDSDLNPEKPFASSSRQALLSIERFSREFGINRLASLEEKIAEILAYMRRNERHFLFGEEETRTFWQRFAARGKKLLIAAVPYLENLICFALIYAFGGILEQSDFFSRIDLYLLYVLLFSLLYGQSQATFSGFLSLLSLLLPIFGDRSQAQVLLDYGTYVWIAQLFIVGLSVGYLKDRLTAQKDEALDDHEYMTNQIEDIREINGINNRVKDALEIQLINHQESIGKIYDITSSLDAYHSVDVLFQGTDVICRIMGTRDVAVYVVHDGSPYARMFTATSAHARQFGNSFLYEETGEMIEAFLEHRIYLNRTWDRNYPAMAIAAYENDSLRFIIMLWTLPLEKMTMGQANLLSIVCKLTNESVMRARRYYDAIRHTQHVENTEVMLREPFRHMVDIYDDAAEKSLTEFVVLRVMQLPAGIEATANLLQKTIRPNDYMGLGLRDDAVYALISNTGAEGGERVIERLREAGLTAVIANHEFI